MYAIIQVRKDDLIQQLCFRSREDAERFQAFVQTYILESGAGNGYGAYWIFNLDIGLYEKPPQASTTEIDEDRLKGMLASVLKNRTATYPPTIKVAMLAKTVKKGIVFTLGDLPPRQRPSVGDMCMRLYDKGPFNAQETQFEQGRVEKDNGDELVVTSSWDEDFGNVRPDAKRLTVRAEAVMKIFDWKKNS